MGNRLLLVTIGACFVFLGCDAAYRIRRDNDRLNTEVTPECIRLAIEKVSGVTVTRDEKYTNPFICGKGKIARRMTYRTENGEVALEACYEGKFLKSFSHDHGKIPTKSSVKSAHAVLSVMREVEKSIEARCSVNGLTRGMKNDCAVVTCGD